MKRKLLSFMLVLRLVLSSFTIMNQTASAAAFKNGTYTFIDYTRSIVSLSNKSIVLRGRYYLGDIHDYSAKEKELKSKKKFKISSKAKFYFDKGWDKPELKKVSYKKFKKQVKDDIKNKDNEPITIILKNGKVVKLVYQCSMIIA